MEDQERRVGWRCALEMEGEYLNNIDAKSNFFLDLVFEGSSQA